jgi:hypothetical protein
LAEKIMIAIKPNTFNVTSRRRFMRVGLFTSAALAIATSPLIDPLLKTAEGATPDLLHDTLNGLLAFMAREVHLGQSEVPTGNSWSSANCLFIIMLRLREMLNIFCAKTWTSERECSQALMRVAAGA